MLNKAMFKIIAMCSLITGVILGIFPLIPQLTGLAFTLIMLLVAPFVIIYLYRLKLIKTFEVSTCLSIGAISGFFAFLGFVAVYFPIALILNLIFKINSYIWIKVLFVNIGFLMPMIISTALLSALFNMFTAFMTVYLYEYFNRKDVK